MRAMRFLIMMILASSMGLLLACGSGGGAVDTETPSSSGETGPFTVSNDDNRYILIKEYDSSGQIIRERSDYSIIESLGNNIFRNDIVRLRYTDTTAGKISRPVISSQVDIKVKDDGIYSSDEASLLIPIPLIGNASAISTIDAEPWLSMVITDSATVLPNIDSKSLVEIGQSASGNAQYKLRFSDSSAGDHYDFYLETGLLWTAFERFRSNVRIERQDIYEYSQIQRLNVNFATTRFFPDHFTAYLGTRSIAAYPNSVSDRYVLIEHLNATAISDHGRYDVDYRPIEAIGANQSRILNYQVRSIGALEQSQFVLTPSTPYVSTFNIINDEWRALNAVGALYGKNLSWGNISFDASSWAGLIGYYSGLRLDPSLFTETNITYISTTELDLEVIDSSDWHKFVFRLKEGEFWTEMKYYRGAVHFETHTVKTEDEMKAFIRQADPGVAQQILDDMNRSRAMAGLAPIIID